MNLYELSDEYSQIAALLQDEDADFDAIAQQLDALDQTRDKKADAIAAFIQDLLAIAAARKSEAKRMAELAATDENKAKRLKAYLQDFLEQQGLKRLDTTRFRLTVTNNGGKLPLILEEGLDPEQLPEQYRRVRTSVSVDADAVRAAIEDGQQLSWAHLGERGRSLRIK